MHLLLVFLLLGTSLASEFNFARSSVSWNETISRRASAPTISAANGLAGMTSVDLMISVTWNGGSDQRWLRLYYRCATSSGESIKEYEYDIKGLSSSSVMFVANSEDNVSYTKLGYASSFSSPLICEYKLAATNGEELASKYGRFFLGTTTCIANSKIGAPTDIKFFQPFGDFCNGYATNGMLDGNNSPYVTWNSKYPMSDCPQVTTNKYEIAVSIGGSSITTTEDEAAWFTVPLGMLVNGIRPTSFGVTHKYGTNPAHGPTTFSFIRCSTVTTVAECTAGAITIAPNKLYRETPGNTLTVKVKIVATGSNLVMALFEVNGSWERTGISPKEFTPSASATSLAVKTAAALCHGGGLFEYISGIATTTFTFCESGLDKEGTKYFEIESSSIKGKLLTVKATTLEKDPVCNVELDYRLTVVGYGEMTDDSESDTFEYTFAGTAPKTVTIRAERYFPDIFKEEKTYPYSEHVTIPVPKIECKVSVGNLKFNPNFSTNYVVISFGAVEDCGKDGSLVIRPGEEKLTYSGTSWWIPVDGMIYITYDIDGGEVVRLPAGRFAKLTPTFNNGEIQWSVPTDFFYDSAQRSETKISVLLARTGEYSNGEYPEIGKVAVSAGKFTLPDLVFETQYVYALNMYWDGNIIGGSGEYFFTTSGSNPPYGGNDNTDGGGSAAGVVVGVVIGVLVLGAAVGAAVYFFVFKKRAVPSAEVNMDTAAVPSADVNMGTSALPSAEVQMVTTALPSAEVQMVTSV